ncbi:serine hydrolase domain-containing protein [Leifsonia shinshuensis]|uniref:CubicO group peptidase (Beta-lactamase class C family) n=1 Tax=Leifsonia shinshuensis TaxID=150026 RepID=A0A853D1X0_9MICO|nr:serine hydrolase domain-containing protein [Leifsonia shinshuensis]NYJ25461.1 CubicO group peptidase (beta-lactamase class C family) [Leifsonia shinshuensis]
MADIHGDTERGYEPLADAFAAAFRDRPTMGAGLSVRVGGHRVVDLWGGVADERTGRPWTADTPTVIFSCTKGLMSVLVARLVQEGRLDYAAPVARYWPEFAAAGKAGVTVAELLSHRAGLSAPREPFGMEQLLDWDAATDVLARQSPLWEPGTGYAYHAITHGWLAGELVRRVTGRSPGDYFAELVSPITEDAWIGLPDAQAARVAHLQASASQLEAGEQLLEAPSEWTGLAMTLGGALPAALVTPDGGFNDPRVRAAQIPGAGGIATADALAAIWSSTVVDTAGTRLLDDATLARAVVPTSWGEPVFPTPGPWPRWGRGLQLDSEARRYLGPAAFGHDGAGGQVAFADPEAQVGFAFVTNWLEAGADDRATTIVDALRAVLAERVPALSD